MNDNKLTYILLLIASVFLILNGIFAFEKSIIMVLFIFFLYYYRIIIRVCSYTLFIKTKNHKKEEHQCSSFLHVKQFYLHIFRLHYMIN